MAPWGAEQGCSSNIPCCDTRLQSSTQVQPNSSQPFATNKYCKTFVLSRTIRRLPYSKSLWCPYQDAAGLFPFSSYFLIKTKPTHPSQEQKPLVESGNRGVGPTAGDSITSRRGTRPTPAHILPNKIKQKKTSLRCCHRVDFKHPKAYIECRRFRLTQSKSRKKMPFYKKTANTSSSTPSQPLARPPEYAIALANAHPDPH